MSDVRLDAPDRLRGTCPEFDGFPSARRTPSTDDTTLLVAADRFRGRIS